jgi:hypothetical protein
MILHDLRHAFRQLIRIPVFSVTAIVTLALGIGANSAIFSVVNAVLRHPAGVDHPERVAIQNTSYKQLGMDFPGVSVPDYADAAALHDQVEAAAIVSATSLNMLHNGRVEHLSGARVSSQWFQVFGARPILGRTFTAEEDEPNTGPVAVISFGLWQSVFGGSRDAIGRSLMLDQKPYQVIGVMRSDFDWPRRNQVWVPIGLAPKEFAPDQRYNEIYRAVLRLRPGASVAQVNAGLAEKVREEYRREGKSSFGMSSQWSMYTSPLTESAAGS